MLKLTFSKLYNDLTRPKSADEDVARRERVFNVLLLLHMFLVVLALIVCLAYGHSGHRYSLALGTILFAAVALVLMYMLSRRKFCNRQVYAFVTVYLMVGTYVLFTYGYFLLLGLLLYGLVIIVSGILISGRASLRMALITTLILNILAYLQISGISHPYTSELGEPPKKNLAFGFIFFVIFLVLWLSNREIERSLEKARHSEKLLRKERDKLEVKIKERTSQLEKSQVEKTLELYKFAEFGRLTSSLLHDIADPLTVMSLNLEELKGKKETKAMSHIREGVNHIDQYVQAARYQLASQSQHKSFDSKAEIKNVVVFLSSKARASQVKINSRLVGSATLYGDRAKFSQIIANLIANAVDSYKASHKDKKEITVTSKVAAGRIVITVHDQGSGVKRSEIKQIFKPFFTTKSADRGTGIGLTITKRIIEEDFLGSVRVTSSKSAGTTFTVKLPLYDEYQSSNSL